MKSTVLGALLKGCVENQAAIIQVRMEGIGLLHNLEATGFKLLGDPGSRLPEEFHEKWGVGTVKAFNTILKGATSVRQTDVIEMIVYAYNIGLTFDVSDEVEKLFAVPKAA